MEVDDSQIGSNQPKKPDKASQQQSEAQNWKLIQLLPQNWKLIQLSTKLEADSALTDVKLWLNRFQVNDSAKHKTRSRSSSY